MPVFGPPDTRLHPHSPKLRDIPEACHKAVKTANFTSILYLLSKQMQLFRGSSYRNW
jgi:hypothetical protein